MGFDHKKNISISPHSSFNCYSYNLLTVVMRTEPPCNAKMVKGQWETSLQADRPTETKTNAFNMVLCSVLFVSQVGCLSEIKGLVSVIESCRPAGLQLQAGQLPAYPPLRNHQYILMSPSTSCSHWPIRQNFPVAGSDPRRFEQEIEPGPSLLRFWRGCKVHTEVRALMYFEPRGCSEWRPSKSTTKVPTGEYPLRKNKISRSGIDFIVVLFMLWCFKIGVWKLNINF